MTTQTKVKREAQPAQAPAASGRDALAIVPPAYGIELADRREPSVAAASSSILVGSADDPLEREADRIADQVMSMHAVGPLSAAPRASVQRKCSSCEEDPLARRTPEPPIVIHRKAAPGAGHAVPPAIESGVRALRGGGQPLPDGERSFFESRLGFRFDRVRVHTDRRAAQLARDLGARAFTYESHIAFAPGQWAPGTAEGRRLLAHELAHVAQTGSTDGRVLLTRDPTLPRYLEAVRGLAAESRGQRAEDVVRRILSAVSEINLLDADNLQPITEIVARQFPREVLELFVQTVSSMHARIRLMQVRGSPYMGPGGVGLFPHMGAMASPVLLPLIDLWNQVAAAGSAFFQGFFEGLRAGLSPADFEALTRNLAWSSVITAVAPVIFVAGTAHGILRDVYDTIVNTIEILGNITEIVASIVSFIEEILHDPTVARDLGRASGEDLATRIRTLAHQNAIAFTYELGKLVGPTIVYVILSFLGIPELAMAAGLSRMATVLRNYPRLAGLMRRASGWFRRRVHPSMRHHVPDPDAPRPRPQAPHGDAPDAQRPRDADRPRDTDRPHEGETQRGRPVFGGVCVVGSFNCRRLPADAVREAGPDPHGTQVPMPSGPFEVRGGGHPVYDRLRAEGPDILQSRYLSGDPRRWTPEFRRAWQRANNGANPDVMDAAARRRSRWPTDANGESWQVHHRKPIAFGGDGEFPNLVPLPVTLHRQFNGWWGRLRTALRRLYVERGGTNAGWREIVGDESVVQFPTARGR